MLIGNALNNWISRKSEERILRAKLEQHDSDIRRNFHALAVHTAIENWKETAKYSHEIMPIDAFVVATVKRFDAIFHGKLSTGEILAEWDETSRLTDEISKRSARNQAEEN
ncbi:MAG: hypothetical protein LBD68_07685, partial [Zoogloeaceae bacterium]|jgi:hypothetical protein|nr:hypothetical protein [Zoogloeaceae bacterium]